MASVGLYLALPPFTPWREMAALIEKHHTAGEAVYIASPQVLASPVNYYYGGDADYLGNYPVSADDAVEGIWVCFREPLGAAAAKSEVAKYVHTNFTEVTHYAFHRGTVVHLRPGPANATPASAAAEAGGIP